MFGVVLGGGVGCLLVGLNYRVGWGGGGGAGGLQANI